MDTIIYLYRWKRPNLTKQQNMQELYCREEFAMPDYYLIRIGLTERFLQICQNVCNVERGCRPEGSFFAGYRRKKQWEKERLLLEQWLQEMEAGQKEDCFVCEETIPYFAGRCFNGYFEKDWVKHMLRYRDCLSSAHYVILGQSYCMPEIIYDLASGMKSLKWILPKRLYRKEAVELVDALYEEYGLAVEVRLFSEQESYKQVYPVSRVPCLILDFSETDRIPTADVARGSIWLDMASSEEKRRRIEDRDTGIRYFSLKKEWKQPQKALNYLDTISKNEYNT